MQKNVLHAICIGKNCCNADVRAKLRYKFKVVNTYLVPATTHVRVDCLWVHEEEGGGGGAGGGGADVIPGWADGTAKVETEGTFYVKATPSVGGVGVPLIVNAYAGNDIPVDANWTIESGEGYFVDDVYAGVKSVNVVSDEGGQTEVKGMYCVNTNFTDKKTLTFVEVLSISAEPDVVCAGTTPEFTVVTNPEGYENYTNLVSIAYNPDTPGVKEVIGTCGTSAATCTVTVVGVKLVKCEDYGVESETDDPGEPETIYASWTNDPEAYVELIVEPDPDDVEWPEGCLEWEGAEQDTEDPAKARVPRNVATLSVEDAVVRAKCGTSSKAVRVIVVKLDLEYDGLPEEWLAPPGEPNEEEPGGFICVNDNDNAGGEEGGGNGTPDFEDDAPLPHADPDLKQIKLILLPTDLEYGKATMTLPGVLRIWKDEFKHEPPGKKDDSLLEWEMPAELPTPLYLEGYSPGAGAVTLSYEYDGKISLSDKVNMTVFKMEIKRSVDGGPYESITDENRNVLPGQKMDLKLDTGDLIATNFQWSIPGVIFKDYIPTYDTGVVVNISSEEMKSMTMIYYWADTGDDRNITCSATISGHSHSTSASLNVKKPLCTLSVEYLGSVVVREVTDQINRTYTVLGLLGPIDEYKKGILLEGRVDMPEGFDEGDWFFSQIVTPGRWREEANGQNREKLELNGCLCLDGDYQWGGHNTGNSDQVKDNPSIGLVGDGIEEGNWVKHESDEVFTTYIMFRPPGDDVRDVPLQFVQWTWKGVALKGPLRWYLDPGTGDQSASSPAETTMHPQWLHHVAGNYITE